MPNIKSSSNSSQIREEKIKEEQELQIQLQYEQEIKNEVQKLNDHLFAENTLNDINRYMYNKHFITFKKLSYEHLIQFKNNFFR